MRKRSGPSGSLRRLVHAWFDRELDALQAAGFDFDADIYPALVFARTRGLAPCSPTELLLCGGLRQFVDAHVQALAAHARKS